MYQPRGNNTAVILNSLAARAPLVYPSWHWGCASAEPAAQQHTARNTRPDLLIAANQGDTLQSDECGVPRRKRVGLARFAKTSPLWRKRRGRRKRRRCARAGSCKTGAAHGPPATRSCSAYGVYDERKHAESACCTSTRLPLGITSGLCLGEFRRDQKRPGLAACTVAMRSQVLCCIDALKYCVALMYSSRSPS